MIKVQFTQEKLEGYGVALGFEFSNVKVRHPYHKYDLKQPTFAASLRVWRWQGYMMVYKPAKVMLNRKERRANHLV